LNVRFLYISLFFVFSIISFTTYADVGNYQSNHGSRFIKTVPISNQACISCHTNEASQWRKSDHHKSMAIATIDSIKGNFNNIDVEHYGQKSHFYIKNDLYYVKTSYDDKPQTFLIKYTFGHYPLQQYLVETKEGSLQVLPFAWDSRNKSEGGQRWYHNYTNEEIRPQDRLHWRQPLQNWNGMCADCHSDGLVRQYDSDKNQFKTQWDNINVGCLSCHGDMSEHSESKQNVTSAVITRKVVNEPLGQWLRNIGDKTAHWQGSDRDNKFMDNCFACHSLRSPLTDGFKANKAFLDQFSPQLLQAPIYHPDGQIKEEVYVYGSFLQSKMYAAGVNCLDCHDKHTMKVKVEGNGLCLQCHSAEVFNDESHHQHQENSEGSLCVNCHMPSNRYMGVDDRRDHSFKIPRPEISSKHATPNACVSCHEQKTNDWANKSIINWHVKRTPLSKTRQHFMALQSGQAITMPEHLAIIADESLNVITRATALQLLAQYGQPISAALVMIYLQHPEDLIRMSVATLGSLMSLPDQQTYISPLLKDKRKAVRVAASRSLIGANLTAQTSKNFLLAFQELVIANQVNSWRGEGRANQASDAMNAKDWLGTEKNFLAAIEIDPYFEQAYTNLSEFYRQTQQTANAEKILKKGLNKLPKASSVLYAYGLHLIREQKHQQAVLQFQRAHLVAPAVDQYLYTYVLSLDNIGQSEQGLTLLIELHKSFQGNKMIGEIGMYLSKKLQNKAAYETFMKL
jgi:predicted CXXCH cytochrome family protein